MFNLRSLGFGLTLALMDAISFPFVKNVSMGLNPMWMIIPTILYSFSPYVLLQALKMESLVIMNLLWDLSSDIVVTLIGILFFKEHLSPLKMVGVCLSLVSIFLMSYDEKAKGVAQKS
jgi:multidrug transporter EmrE-like cation transporter